MTATCIIVDDEPVSRGILRKYISDIPSLQLLGECKDAFEATKMLTDSKVDILFLDINMPRLSGIRFARSLSSAPLIIFTTAYPEYAVEGFDVNAVDYLVKPFAFERFLKSVNRAIEILAHSKDSDLHEENILVRSDKKVYALKAEDIAYIEGCGDYIKIFRIDDSALMVHDTLKGFLSSLPEDLFMRIHKSYLVNLKKVSYLEGNTVRVLEKQLPLSPGLRETILERLK